MSGFLPLLGRPGGMLLFTLLFTIGLQLLIGTPLLALLAGGTAADRTGKTAPAPWIVRTTMPAICLGMVAGLPLLFRLGGSCLPLYRGLPVSFLTLGTTVIVLAGLALAFLFLFSLAGKRKGAAAAAGLLALGSALALLPAAQLLVVLPEIAATGGVTANGLSPAAGIGSWTALPLLVHLLAGAPALTGLLLMLAAAYQKDYRRRYPREFYLRLCRFGGRWTLLGFLAQLGSGGWIFFTLPPATRAAALAGGQLAIFATALVCLLLGLLLLAKILHDNLANSRAATIVTILLFTAVLLTFVGAGRWQPPTAGLAAGPPPQEVQKQ